jgi:hypothetical protein
MTPQPAAAPRLPVHPAVTNETLAAIFGVQRPDPDRAPTQPPSRQEDSATMVAALCPRGPIETAYATRAVAAHYGSLECIRRAMLPDVPDIAAIRWHGRAVALSRMNTEMTRELEHCQAAAPRAAPRPGPAMPAPAVPTQVAAARPDAALAARPVGRQNPMSSERPSPTPAAQAVTVRPAATPAKPTGRQDPMSSERPSFVPAASVLMTGPAATSFLSAAPPRQSLRADLLGSTADIAAMLAAANVQARLHVQ